MGIGCERVSTKRMFYFNKIVIMDRSIILQQVNKIFIEVIDEDSISLNESSTAKEVDGWDSLTHIQLVVAIEKHFKIRFTSKEIQEWKNVGALVDSINSKLTI